MKKLFFVITAVILISGCAVKEVPGQMNVRASDNHGVEVVDEGTLFMNADFENVDYKIIKDNQGYRYLYVYGKGVPPVMTQMGAH